MAKLSFLAKLKFQWPAALSWLVLCSLLLGMLPGAANGDTEESYYDVELGECAFKAFAGDSFRCDRAGIREAITRCVVVAENSPPPALRMIAPDVPFAHILVDASLSFTSNAGLPNISWSLPSAPEVAEAMTSDLMGNRIHHAYVLPSNAIGDMTTAFGIAQDLSELTAIDNDLDWLGLLPLYRDALAVYDGAVRAIPTQGTMAQLYFRRDLLAAEGLQPPRTWAEVVSYATKFNGTDLNDDGVADYGICMWRDTCGGMPIPLVAILASLAQSKGRHSGLFFEPESMRCVVDTVAWDATLRLARTLASLAAPISAEPPSYTRPCFSHPLFSEGRCAMALALAGQFKSDSWPNNTGSYVRGRIGTSTLPGSEVVLDWQQDTLVQCDPDLCPYATRESISCSSSSGSDKLLANSSTSQRRRLRAGRRDLLQSDQAAVVNISSGSSSSPPPAATGAAEAFIWVNRAPYATSGGQSIFISKLKTVPQRLAAYTVAVLMVRDADNWPLVAGPGTEFGPTRQEHLDAVSKWAEYGYHPQDLAGFLSAARESLASGNVAIDLRAAGFSVFNDLFNNAAMMVVNTSMPIDDVIAYTRQKFAERLNNSAEAALLRSSYKASINFRTPKPPPPPYVAPAPASGQSQRNVAIHALAASLAGATTLSVVLVCVVWQLRSTRRLRYRFGRITAPGAGLATTICITDIEGSTRLWETLPGDVMSQAIQLHNQCIRHCATANNGYESAWEGDSVILGFHCAEDAVAFSVCVQERLLWLPWPEQLLEVDECRPMWLAKAPEAAQPPRTAPQSAVRPPSTAEDRRVSWSSTAATQLEPRPTIGAEHVRAAARALLPGFARRARAASALWTGLTSSGAFGGSAPYPLRFSGTAAGPARTEMGLVTRRSSVLGTAAMRFAVGADGGDSGLPRLVSRAYQQLAVAIRRCPSRILTATQLGAAGDGSPRAGGGSTTSGLESPAEGSCHESTSPDSPTVHSRPQSHALSFIDASNFGGIGASDPRSEPRRRPSQRYPGHGCGAGLTLLASSLWRKASPLRQGNCDAGEATGSGAAVGQEVLFAGNAQSPRSTVRELYCDTYSVSGPDAKAEDSAAEPQMGPAVPSRRSGGGCADDGLTGASASSGLPASSGRRGRSNPCPKQLHDVPSSLAPPDVASVEGAEDEGTSGITSATAASQRPGDTCGSALPRGPTRAARSCPNLIKGHRNAVLTKAASGARLVLCGLRIRIGCHSGVHAAVDVVHNRASARVTYTGVPMAKARAVISAAPGGMVLVSASTHALVTKTAGSQATCVVLPNKYSRNLSGGAPGILFWHAGVHHLDEHLSQPLEVFKVSTPSLAPRWALLQEPGPADKARTVSQGVAAAPVGHVFMSAVAVSGGAAIAAWNIGLWRESTGLLWREAASLCTLHGGFLATTRAGVGAVPSQPNRTGASGGRSVEVLLTAAFPAAAAALRWAASLIAHGLLADWPAALLLHEMAEEQLWLAPMPNRREPRQPPHGMTHESGGAVLGAQSAVGVQHGSVGSVLPPVAGSHQPSLPHLRASRTSSGGQEASAGAAQGFNGDQVTPRLRTRLGSSPALTLLNEVRPQATVRTKPGTDPGEESTLSTLTVDPASGAGAAVGFLPAPEGTWLPADALAKAKSVGPEPAAEAAPLPAEKSVPSTRLQVLLADCASQGRTAPKPPHCSPFAVDSSAEAQKTLQRPPPLAQAVNLGRGARPILANLPLLGSSTVPQIEFLTVSHVSSSRGPLLPMRVPVRDVVCLPGHDARLQQVLSLPSDCSTYGAFPTPSQPPGLESGGNGYNESTQSSIWNGFASIAAPTHDCFGPVVRRPGLAASHGAPGVLPLSDDTASGGVPCAMRALQQPGGASAGSAPGAASEEATPSAAPKSRVPFLLGTAVRPTAVQVPAGDLAGGAVQCNTDQVARLFAARHIQGGTGDGEGGNDVGDGQEEEEAGSPRSTLPTALLDRLIARGLRLRAGVEGGMAYVEVGSVLYGWAVWGCGP
ncbi:hypothetical protein Agub_g15489 [Astrephomene gubernaculifera]|uniref:Guanylate cyclase domain-containing protein n=1 Tax=Astrephomene gubernaculifera TaxID=47775 RepID=A0AAD3E4R8_9CHLO|nr:hypothetical protein Agub_g15489 [Astrephomene gubernaculifera]